jgi:hypothetical protein
MKQPPVQLEPFYGPRREFNFDKEIQPVFNAKCISCHNGGVNSGGLDLRQGKAYDALTSHGACDAFSKYVNWMPAEDSPILQPPNRFGSSKSSLDAVLEKGHKDIKMTDEEMRKIRCWIDIGVPRYGRYQDAIPGTEANLTHRNAWIAQEKRNIADYLQAMATPVHDNKRNGVALQRESGRFALSCAVLRTGAIRIHLTMPAYANGQNVQINLYDLKGTLVRTLFENQVTAGLNIMTVETGILAAGQYLIEAHSQGIRNTLQVAVLK